MNKRNMVDIDLDQLPRVPGDFSPEKPRHLTAIDVYGKELGVLVPSPQEQQQLVLLVVLVYGTD